MGARESKLMKTDVVAEGYDMQARFVPAALESGTKQAVLGKGCGPMTRIMHIITGLDTGGAEMMLMKLLYGASADWNSVVVSLGDEGAIGAQISRLGVPVHSLHLRQKAPSPSRIMSLIRLTKKFRPQAIQGWMPHGNLMASLVGRMLCPHVPVFWNVQMSLYDVDLEPWSTRTSIRLGALLSKRADAIIYNSRLSATQHEEFGYDARKRRVIATGFDCNIFYPAEEARKDVLRELGLESSAILVGLVARYHPMKDHAGFFRAAGRIAQGHPEARFILVGKGLSSKDAPLQELILSAGLKNCVLLLGERRDIPRLTAALDVACSASAWGEGCSNAIGEAMACGVPCVVTDVGDSAYLVGDTGLIVPPRNPEALAVAIGRLVDAGLAKRKELGIAARRRIESEFSLPRIARRYQEVYKECLECPR